MSRETSRANYGWLRLGVILVLLLADLHLASLLFSDITWASFAAAAPMVAGLLNLAMTVIAYAFASVLLLVQ